MDTLDEKKEQIIMQYMLSYDIDIAMLQAGITVSEKSLLIRDEAFMYRINFQDAKIKEDIISTMTDNMRNGDPKLSQKAAIDLGNILWPEKFKTKGDENKGLIIPDTIILTGEE